MSRSLALTLCALTGCHAPLTELVVVADTDFVMPSELDMVRFEIEASAIGGSALVERSVELSDARMPIVLGLLHEGQAPLGPIEVRVIGLLEGRERVRKVARTSFVRERSLVLRMDLLRRCDGVSCAAGDTCGADGACVDARIDPATLPRWGSNELDAMVVGPGMDGGVDAGTDGGPPPDPRCAVVGCCLASDECDDGCGCSGGCTCDLQCSPADTCADPIPFCSGVGTSCHFKADDNPLFHFRCESGAYCVTDIRNHSTVGDFVCSGAECWTRCKDSSDCPIRCEDGASCVLRCENADNCRFETCHTAVVTCDDGVYACNHACPTTFPAW